MSASNVAARTFAAASRIPPARLTGLLILLVLLLAGCAGGAAPGRQDGPPDSPAPALAELTATLQAEFDRLGIDPDKVAAQAPSGAANAVFDLQGEILFEDPPLIIFSWTERMLGDFNQDSLVGVSDLTPIGQRYDETVDYDDPAAHDGLAYWPTGDPDNGGAANWRLARVDGNDDGLIYLTDITTIAQHWEERLSGYRLYHQSPSMSEFEMVPNPDEPSSPLTIARAAADPGDPGRPFRYTFEHIPQAEQGYHQFYVAPYDDSTGTEGTASPILTLPEEGEPPVADLVADVTAGNPPLTVNFDASGSTDLEGSIDTYEWDFDGDGTYTEETDDPAATHVYPDSGTFTAVVRVTDRSFQTDTASLEIVVNTPPVAVVVVDPEEAVVPFWVTFAIDNSYDPDGEIVLYEWDTDDDGDYDLEYTEPTTRARQYTFPGEFLAVLRVTDDGGLTDTETAKVTPLYGEWAIQTVGDSPDAGDGCSLAVVGSEPNAVPAIAYHDETVECLRFVRASDPTGTAAWNAPQQLTDDPLDEGMDPSLAVISGNPAIAYFNWGESRVEYIRATNETGSEWTQDPVLITDLHCSDPSLCEVAGRPTVAYQPNSFDIYYQIADDQYGTAWSTLPRDIDGGGDDHWEPSLAVIGGIPGVAYIRRDSSERFYLMYVHATDTAGADPWNTPVVAYHHGVDDTGFRPSLTELGGTPVISFAHGTVDDETSRPYVIHSQSSTGADGSWDWPGGTDLSDHRDQFCSSNSLAVIEGKLHVVFYDPSRNWLWHCWGGDEINEEWFGPVVVDDGDDTNDVGRGCSLADVGGKPAVAYVDATAGVLKYAILQ
jgi:PKD repeat protein